MAACSVKFVCESQFVCKSQFVCEIDIMPACSDEVVWSDELVGVCSVLLVGACWVELEDVYSLDAILRRCRVHGGLVSGGHNGRERTVVPASESELSRETGGRELERRRVSSTWRAHGHAHPSRRARAPQKSVLRWNGARGPRRGKASGNGRPYRGCGHVSVGGLGERGRGDIPRTA